MLNPNDHPEYFTTLFHDNFTSAGQKSAAICVVHYLSNAFRDLESFHDLPENIPTPHSKRVSILTLFASALLQCYTEHVHPEIRYNSIYGCVKGFLDLNDLSNAQMCLDLFGEYVNENQLMELKGLFNG